MRYVSLATFVIAVSTLTPGAAFGQIDSTKLTIDGYQLLSQVPVTLTQSYFTYRASLVNSGPAIPAITATVTSLLPASASVVSGKGNLHFPPAPAHTTVTSLDSFTILVDRTAIFGFNTLRWSFVSPVANAGPDQTAAVGSTVTLNGSGSTNPSGVGTLTYNWAFTSVPQGSQATLTNAASVTPTFIPDVTGNYVITLTVGNGAGTDSASVNVNVNTTAPPPVANAGPNQTVDVGTTVHLDGSQSHDFNGRPLTYSWTLIQRPAGSAANLTGANTVSPTFVADVVTTGTTNSYIAQLVVNDGTSNSPPALVTIVTTPVNTAPVANAGPNQSVAIGAVVQLDGSKSTDVDGDPLIYQWSLITLPAGSKARISNPGIVNPTFTVDVAGTYIAQLIVEDGTTASNPSTVMITTTTKPVANAGPDQTVQIGPVPVTLSGTGSDPQGLPLTFHWTIQLPPGSNAFLSNPAIANPTFVPDVPGQYIAHLTVNNGVLNSDPSIVTITAKDTQPVANAGPAQTVSVGTTAVLNGSGSSDSDQAPLTYKWTLLTIPAGSKTVLLSPTTVSPTFVADVAGTYVAQLIVNDGFQDSVPSTVMITAIPANFITLSPDPLNLVNNTPGTLTIALGSPALTDVTVTLTVLDTTVATAPKTVTIPAGSATATATITPLKIGTTNILASAPLNKPGSATINVGAPSLTLTLSAPAVGIGNTVTGTITLNSPAPAAGINVALSLDKTGDVSLSPTTVNIAGGNTTGTFTVTGGPNTGLVTITASSSGYPSSSATIISVTQGTIILQQGVVITPGQSLPFTVTLDRPAVNPVTITLTSSAPSKLTVSSSVVIPAGATTPSTPAQVTGVNFGSATVTASATGYIGDSETVLVESNLSFMPQAATVGAGTKTNLILTVPGSAMAGVVITLTSDNTKVATVPATVAIAPGQNTANVTVTAVAPGVAHITASSALLGIVDGSATINVVAVPVITTTSLPSGALNAAYTATVAGTGGITPYTWSATGLPAGLTINSGTGVISGTPTAAGTSTASITLKDASTPQPQTVTASLSITISGQVAITTTTLPAGAVNVAYTATVVGTGGTTPYTWSATGLPAGLTINSSTGLISGAPTTAGTSTASITLKDASSPQQTATASLSITVGTQLAITTASLPAGAANVAYTATVVAISGTTPYTWSATGLPAGLTINSSTGVISGTPTTGGTSTASITVKDASSPQQTATASFSITIVPKPIITTLTLPAGVVNVPYTATVAASSGTTPYTWSATGLPAGLTINSSTGVISGTPTTGGTSTASITVKDASTPQQSATASLSITIKPKLSITTTSLPTGAVNVPYSVTVAASGGTLPYTWSATGLPAGLTINSSTGAISGTPTTAGTGAASITVTDASSTQQTATASLSITIAAQLAITTTTLPAGVVNVPYTATVVAISGTMPYTWSATGLPTGLTINSSTGVISGTPTTAGASGATITVKDATSPQQTATASLSITIKSKLAITTTSLPAGVANIPYNTTVTASGGTTPYTWSATGLPAGLTINSSTGVISGTPTTAGTSAASITVKDASSPQQTATASLSITIAAQLAITTTTLPAGVVNVPYTATLAATNGTTPYTWSATGLPAGLTINASTGVISGTPTTAGTSAASITVKDAGSPQQTATASLSITVKSKLAITNTSLPAGAVNVPYSATVTASSGTTPYTWSATGLPAGLTINSSTGTISGTPTSAGTSSVSITVKDSGSPQQTATASLSIAINTQLTITTTSLPGGILNAPYSATVMAISGTMPYTWSATGLPTGLTINSSTGVISGTPTKIGTNSASITVKDASNPQQSVTTSLSITVKSTLAITTTSLTGGAVNTPYTATVLATGGTTPYTWSATGLPAGLTINSGTGVISGTPTTAGTSSASITVKDAGSPQQTATTSLSITINTQLGITTTSLTGGIVNVPYNVTVAASGGTTPYIWSATGLPTGLTINSSTGVISGTPTTAGTSAASITVKDASSPQQSAAASLSITVSPKLAITTTSLPAGVANVLYTATVTGTGGTTPNIWSATGLPAGLTINSTTGVISGTPTTAGTSSVSITVKDAGSPQQTATASLSITISSKLAITTTSLPAGFANVLYTTTVTGTGGTTPYTWSATGLPAGLTINSTTGVISGTPTTAGTSSASITVKDAGNPQQSAMASLSITISPKLAITTTSLVVGAAHTSYTATVQATGGTTPYTWSATGLPAGLTINAATGVISGTPTAAGTSTASITVKDASTPQQTATASLTITINTQLTITTTSLPGGIVNATYNATVAAISGTTPYIWSATGLPSGLTINSTTGVISGTPTTAGTSNASITVKDASNPQQSVTASLSITIKPKLAITTTSLPAGAANTLYTPTTVLATGGTIPYTWSATGLPAGLTINSSTGVISGTPTTAGTSSASITVKDAGSPQQSVTASLSITIGTQLTITSSSLPAGTVSFSYTATVTATGGTTPYTWSATGLPAGLTINSSTGVISGTPTTAGTTSASITVKDAGSPQQTANASLSITIKPKLAITTTTLPAGAANTLYTPTQVLATGGTTPYTWSATGLPAGLTINSSTGVISGTPTTAGTSSVSITVKDAGTPQQSATASLSITIGTQLTITTTSLPGGIVNAPYTATVAAISGITPYTWSATGLPAGLTINNSTGVISGTPTTAGTTSASITVKDAGSPQQSVTASLSITIKPKLAITTTTLPAGAANTLYTPTTVSATGGTTPYTWSATGLPAGLTINNSTGVISGTPTAAGTSSVSITVKDAGNPQQTATASLSITINTQLTITTTSLPGGIVNAPYTATVVAISGITPYTWSATGLPAGLTINSSTGVISGTPTTAGTTSASITVKDAGNPQQSVTASFSIAIKPKLAITTTSLTGGAVNTPYTATVAASGGTTPYTWSATGLPAGLTINSGTGVISGTPTAAGTSSASITVTDVGSPQQTATATLSITINPQLTITTTSLAAGVANVPYTATVAASGGTGPYTWSATGLPAGLTINSGTGVISGTPTTAGLRTASITVQDAGSPQQTKTTSLSITIDTQLIITTASLASGVVTTPYTATVAATGGTGPYTWSATGLPAGLTINTGTGVISGTPTTAGTSSATITVKDVGTPQQTATASLSITIKPKLVITTTSPLPPGPTNAPYSTTVAATGGTPPYTWSATGLPAGLTINAGTGVISGLPTTAGTSAATITVKDVGTPQQTATASLSITITIVGSASITITGGTVGQKLQIPITVTLSPASGGGLVQITSSNPSNVKLAAHSVDAGSGTLNVQVATGQTTFSIFAQGVTSGTSATLTASATNYNSGGSTVTVAPSAFVLAGPNGIGGSFVSGENTATPLSISSAQLDSSGNVADIQPVAGGQTIVVPLAVGSPSLGTVAPTSVTFTGGVSNASSQFTAGTSTVSSTITASEPAGFSTPAGSASVLGVTIQNISLSCKAVTVGQNLENSTTCSLSGTTLADLAITITSNNPGAFLLSSDPTLAGSTSITRPIGIRAGGSSTAPFYVYGVGKTGTATFTATAGSFTGTGTVTLAPSGFIVFGPFGLGGDVFATAGGPPTDLTIQTAVLDGSGNYLDTQNLAGGLTANVTVKSSNTAVGTITGSPAVITGANNSASVQFLPTGNGTATITVVTPAGYSTPSEFATLNANVTNPRLLIDSGNPIGKNLERIGLIVLLGASAPSNGLQVTLTATSGALSLSKTGTDAGQPSITVTIPAGMSSGTYFMYGMDVSGSATVTATAPGYTSGSGTETLTPSGIVIAGPQGIGITTFSTPLASGAQTLSVSTAQLDSSGNFVQTQPLAGPAALTISLTDSNPDVGTVPSTASITPGNDTGTVQFNPLTTGTTFIGVTEPGGYSTPTAGANTLKVNVQ